MTEPGTAPAAIPARICGCGSSMTRFCWCAANSASSGVKFAPPRRGRRQHLALVVIGVMLIGVALMFLLVGLLVWLSHSSACCADIDCRGNCHHIGRTDPWLSA